MELDQPVTDLLTTESSVTLSGETFDSPKLKTPAQYWGGTVGISYTDPMVRYASHLLLDAMLMHLPDEGIKELMETMRDIYEFHSSRLGDYQEPKPQIQEMRAVIESTEIRPNFTVLDDEE